MQTIPQIQEWLKRQIADRLEIALEEIDIREPFTSYGLASRDVVALSGELEQLLGRRLSPTLAYDYPSIQSLSEFLVNGPKHKAVDSFEGVAGSAANEPIAIIGMAGRFPGANDLDSFWQLLKEGRDAISEVPEDRWPRDAYYHPDPAVPGKSVSIWGGFLDQVDQFDPFFFGISPIEAKHMDPQQRLLLELSCEALDDAGKTKEQVSGSKTGVFVGISVNEYGHVQFGNPTQITSHAGTGGALSIAANRLSYYYDFHGPSMAIDTACSSSLTAIHQACQSLRSGESRMALAGGVNVILSPAHSIAFTKAGVLAPDGRCKTFDHRANGYVRGEGGGLVVLKKLSAAQADGDPIHAVIMGGALAQDGRTNGLMAPSSESQQALLREAYHRAGVSPTEVQYIEAHGTGTLLGDSMEAQALGAVVGNGRTGEPVAIGSVKTNIGHLEAAAGMAGLIKTVLALRHQTIPPSINFEAPNPHIPFESLNLKVNNHLADWPDSEGFAHAGVSSFGFGGTNVHLILRAAELVEESKPEANVNSCLLPLSASNPESLAAQAQSYQEFLANTELSLSGICHTSGQRRGGSDLRLAVIGRTTQEMAASFSELLAERQDPNIVMGKSEQPPKIAFVFSGQGGQWQGMGHELLRQEPVFRSTVEKIDQAIRRYFDWSLLEVLQAPTDSTRLAEIDLLQPAIFGVQVALAELWRSWGIQPEAVIGHSMGEVAAAHVAGILSLDDAIRVICLRSQLLKKLSGKGVMMVTELTVEQAEDLLEAYDGEVALAAINGPTSTVLSGDPTKMAEIQTKLDNQDLFFRMVNVDVASHSPQMDLIRDEMLAQLDGLYPQPGLIPFFSTVTGQREDLLDFSATYWFDNLRKPVLFTSATEELLAAGYDALIEMGPHPVLLGAIQQSVLPDQSVKLLPSMRREEPEGEVLMRSLGTLYTSGYPVDWDKIYPEPHGHVPLPPIQWQRQRYWMDEANAGSSWQQPGSRASHPLLGNRLELAMSPDTLLWQQTLDLHSLEYLKGHRIGEQVILPASAYIEIALQAVREAETLVSPQLNHFAFLQPMQLQEEVIRTLQVAMKPQGKGFSLSIFSRADSEKTWTLHATADLEEGSETGKISFEEFSKEEATEVNPEVFYELLQSRDLVYEDAFQGVETLWSREREALGWVNLPEKWQYDARSYQLHPALLDACFQVLAGTEAAVSGEGLYMPTGCDQMQFFHQPTGSVWSQVIIRSVESAETLTADLRIWGENQELVAEIFGLQLRRIRQRKPLNLDNNWLYQSAWKVKEDWSPIAPTESQNWLILADEEGLGDALIQQLEQQGDRCHVLRASQVQGADEIGLQQLIENFVKEYSGSLHGVVHLWSLSMPTQDLAQIPKMGSNGVLYLIQALSKRVAGSPRLWLVTRSGQLIRPDENVALEQSALWGLGKVMSFELPEFKCVRVDVDPDQSAAEAAELLFQQLQDQGKEDQVAFRDGKRYVLRLRPFDEKTVAPSMEFPIRDDASYLLTGGLGGLGLETARWMVEQGARNLVLMGRSEPSDSAMRVVDELTSGGAQVVVTQADVSDAEQVHELIPKIDEHLPPLRGIIHAAGVLDDGSLLNLDAERMQRVLAPKVDGSWHLHQATAQHKLDFFVMYSSAVSVLGSPGQGNYAAASAYQDALAHYRQQLGLPAISINWGPWAEVGLAAEAAQRLEEHHASTQHLIKVIEIEAGLDILGYFLGTRTKQVVVLPFDLKNLIELYPTAAGMPFFAEVGGSETHVAKLYSRPNLRQEYVAPRTEIERKLAELWQQTLHIDRVGVQDSFFELGGDSVLAAQILAQARKTYGISINPQDAFQAFTVERLAEMLEAEIMKQIEEMSEEEALRLLSE